MALSLWIHCRVILGTEPNVDSLDLAAVDDLVLSEVCSYESISDLEMPKLEHSNGFDVCYRQLDHFMRLKRNPEGVP